MIGTRDWPVVLLFFETRFLWIALCSVDQASLEFRVPGLWAWTTTPSRLHIFIVVLGWDAEPCTFPALSCGCDMVSSPVQPRKSLPQPPEQFDHRSVPSCPVLQCSLCYYQLARGSRVAVHVILKPTAAHITEDFPTTSSH